MPDANNRPDLFILHSDADAEWVEGWLLPRLEEAGLTVHTAEDFRIGRTVALNYEESVSDSRYVAFVLSPEGLADRWAGFAASLARHRDPDNRTERVLPLLRAASDRLPVELADLTPADFTGARDPERELAKLIGQLQGAEPPPRARTTTARSPSAPATAPGSFYQPDWQPENVTQIAQQNVYVTQTGERPQPDDNPQRLFTVPFPRNDDFVGRDPDLIALHAALSGDEPVGIHSAGRTDLPGFPKPGRSDAPAGLTGQGGMGKTALAVEYCYRHRDDYPGGVFWINAAEPLPQGFAALGCLLDPANFDRPVPRQIDAAARYLNSRADALLVLDNVEDPAALARPAATGLIPTELACRTLFTTRRRDLPARCRPVDVTVLPEDAALSLLLRHGSRQPIQQSSHPEHTQARRICRRLGYLPLALEIAGAFLGEWPEISLGEFRERLEGEGALLTVDEERDYLNPANLPAIHQQAVGAVLATQWAGLDNADARLLLRVAGQLPEAAQIPNARLGLLAGLDGEERPGRPSRLQRALRRLEALSLIEELSGDALRLHPLVREFAAGRTPDNERDDFRRECAARLLAAYGDVARLEDQCARRGIHALEADLTSSLGLLTAAQQSHSHLISHLQRLRQMLERESHVLRGWERIEHPVLFAQQLRHRAVLSQEFDLMTDAAARLADLAKADKLHYLLLAWGTTRTSPGLIRVLSGHEDFVNAVAVVPNGRRAVSASSDRTLRVWNLESGAEERVLTGHEDCVNAVAVTPDGRWAVSASSDRTVRVWDLESGAEEWALTGHEDFVNAVAVTPDGRRAVSASNDCTLRVWDLQIGIQQYTLIGHDNAVLTVAITQDGKQAVSASEDHTVRRWNLDTGTEEQVLNRYGPIIRMVVVTEDRKRVVSASEDQTIRMWNWETGLEERRFRGHTAAVNAIALLHSGTKVISASSDRTLRVWDIGSGVQRRIITGHQRSVLSVAVTDDWRRAISTSQDRTLRIWDLEDDVANQRTSGHQNWVVSIAIIPDGKRAVTASKDRTLRIWNLINGEQLNVLTGHQDRCDSVVVTPDGRRVVSASWDKTIRIWNLENGEQERLLIGHTERIRSIAITPDGRRAISGSYDQTIKVWNLTNGKQEKTLIGHQSSVLSLAVTHDGQKAVSGSYDNTIRVWNLTTGIQEKVLIGHKDSIWSVAVTPDNKRVVSASHDKTVRIWNLNSGLQERVMVGHTYSVRSVAVTPNGRHVVSASSDQTLRVWDIEAGEELAVITLDGALHSIAIAPNGTTLVAGDGGGNVYCLEYVEGRPSPPTGS